jgi:GAF domain-containing protein
MPSHVIATASPCNLADAPSDARFGGLWFLAGVRSPWAAMCVPVADPGTGDVLGCVMVEGRGEGSEFGYFGHDEVQSLRSVALQLAAAIKRCR